MSMQNYPSSGYVVPLTTLKTFLNEAQQAQLENLLSDGYQEDITEFCDRNMPEWLPSFDVYQPQEEDDVDDDMEKLLWYAVFDEDDLFVKTPSPDNLKMKSFNVDPKQANWSVWG